MSKDKFKFYIGADLVKGNDGQMRIKGIASTGHQDSQGEFLDPKTMDLTNFSYINWNHKSKDDPSTLIGEPVLTKITDNNELYIEGVLYDDVPMAKATYKLMKALAKSPNGNKLGMSVEGRVIERDALNPSKILKSKITGVAICPVPVNGNTWTDLITKGYTDDEDPIYNVQEFVNSEMEKAMSIESTTNAIDNEGVDRKIELESVEGVKNKKKKKYLNSLGEEVELKELTKGETYENIFNYFYIDSIVKAKQIYNLIETISTMDKQPITKETIEKALDILSMAAQEVSETSEDVMSEEVEKAAKTKAMEVVKADEAEEKQMPEADENDEDEKEQDDDMEKTIHKAACNYADKMIKKGMGKDEVKAAMYKAFSKDVADMACATVNLEENTQANGGQVEVQKSESIETINKAFEAQENLIKSNIQELSKSLQSKFEAIGTIAKSHSEQVEDIKKSFEVLAAENRNLNERLASIEKAPVGPKSLLSKSFADRFPDGSSNSNQGEVYNIGNRAERTLLINKAFDLSVEKGDGELAKVVTHLEATGSLTASDVAKLKTCNITVVNN